MRYNQYQFLFKYFKYLVVGFNETIMYQAQFLFHKSIIKDILMFIKSY